MNTKYIISLFPVCLGLRIRTDAECTSADACTAYHARRQTPSDDFQSWVSLPRGRRTEYAERCVHATFSTKPFRSHHFRWVCPLTPFELQFRCGDKPLKFQVICPQLSSKRDSSPMTGLRHVLEEIGSEIRPRGWVIFKYSTAVAGRKNDFR